MTGTMRLADTLLVNATAYTMDAAQPRATELAVADGRILAVGDDLRHVVGPATEVVDLGGRCVLPGLTDSHIHFASYALTARRLDLRQAASLDDLLSAVGRRASAAAPAPDGTPQWIEGFGWDQERWPEGRFPSSADLDRVAPKQPVVLRAKSGHALVANTAALERAGITTATPDPAGGRIGRQPNGCPDGMLFEESAMHLVEDCVPAPSDDVLNRALCEAFQSAWRLGLTTIHDMDGADAFAAFQRLHLQEALGLRVVKYLPAEMADQAAELSMHMPGDRNWLRVGGIKVFADGALGARTAALLAPYDGEPDNWGILTIDEGELRILAEQALAGQLPLAVHAIGDRANRLVLDVLTETAPGHPTRSPHRIEHAQLLHSDDIGRFAKLGIVASMQPIHATQDRAMAERYWGARCATAYAWRSLLRVGAVLAFGSDCPVEDLNPFLGIHAAVTRSGIGREEAGAQWYPEQCLTVGEAVIAYTLGPALAAGLKDCAGALAPNMLADLVILDRDIFECDATEIPETRVLATVIAGKFVYREL